MKKSQNNVENLLDFVDQDSVAKSDIQKCIKYLTREVNKQKLNYGQLRYIFRVVRENCHIEVTKGKKSLYELPNSEQISIFYNQISSTQHKLIFKLLHGTGLRISEMCSLEVKNIDFKENLILVKEGKGKKDRIVPIGNKLSEHLTIYLDGKRNRYLFESNRNSKYTPRRIEQICKEYLCKSNLDFVITPHTFRHLYFSFLASKNISKEHRMIIAGHSKPETQDIYTHLTLEGVKEGIIKIVDEI